MEILTDGRATYELVETRHVTIIPDVQVVGSGKIVFSIGFRDHRHGGMEYIQIEKNGSDKLQAGIYHPFHFRHGISHCRLTPTGEGEGTMEVLKEIDQNSHS